MNTPSLRHRLSRSGFLLGFYAIPLLLVAGVTSRIQQPRFERQALNCVLGQSDQLLPEHYRLPEDAIRAAVKACQPP
ncbi:MAG: hypothetical protein VKJ87_01175 [Synechococcus sp.]|nr:hypothetical protein [Synechococcus sp.]